MRSKTICMVLLLLLMMMTSWAMADTAQELYIQAQTPWQETLHAFGREIVLDVQIEMPDVQALNIYRICQDEAPVTASLLTFKSHPCGQPIQIIKSYLYTFNPCVANFHKVFLLKFNSYVNVTILILP